MTGLADKNGIDPIYQFNRNKPIRLLIFTESFHPYTSGIARRFKTIIEYLAHTNEYLIHVVTGCQGCETAWQNDSFMQSKVTYSTSLFSIDFKDKIECALPFLIPQPGLIFDILKFKPDVIHCVEHTPASTFFGGVAKALDIPLIWSSHTNLDFYLPLYIRPITASISVKVYQLLRRTFLNLADYNLTVSQDFSNLLINDGITAPVHIWKTGVDEKTFNPSFRSQEMRKRMFNGYDDENKILLLSVGRLSPEKNFQFLVYLLDKFPQTFLAIVGDGPYKESLRPIFPEEQTNFMGFMQGDELAAAYASADYFVYASVSETFGQVYLESMSSGVPVVAAEGKQMKEFFTNGIHGYTWQPNNLKSAVNAMNLAMKSRETLAKNCRPAAINHSWTNAGKQIATVYSGIIQRKNTKSNLVTNVLSKSLRLVFYLSQWLFIMLLAVIFFLPFLKVSRPQDSTDNQSLNAKSGRSKQSGRPLRKHSMVHTFLRNQLDLLKCLGSKLIIFCTGIFLSFALFFIFSFESS